MVIAEPGSYLSAMKTLLLFIGTVLRSRIIQRKGLRSIPAIYKLVLHWWAWSQPQPDAHVSTVAKQVGPSMDAIATGRVKTVAE